MSDALPGRMTTIRARAKEHQEELDSRVWWTPEKLAIVWNVAISTVMAIPIEQLRYKEFGGGKKLRGRRRYKPEWVEAFENAGNVPKDGAA